MPVEPTPAPSSDPVETAASGWLSRRDRGLTAAEQDRYLEWLRADPRHGPALTRLEKTWRALDGLTEWRPAHGSLPNPDLLARPRRAAAGLFRPVLMGTLAIAATVVGAFLISRMGAIQSAPAAGMRVIPSPERLTLADGSVVELNRGGKIETAFTADTRRVRLVRGEAHFTVTKNLARPFIVDAGGVSVRAVGTAFDVRRASGAVEVLVTEGKVQIERPVVPLTAAVGLLAMHAPAPTPLVAGERAVIDTRDAVAPPLVAPASAGEIAQLLAWQGVRLEFVDLPLAEVVIEFNLRNSLQLVVGNVPTGRLRVAGKFRADNVEAFVRLLEASFDVTAKRNDAGYLLLRREK